MILFPNAKINIGLDIVERRPDGYHNLVSVFYPLPWHDVLELTPATGAETTLTVTGRGCDCPPEKNLVVKAWRALAEVVPELPAVDIHLRKIIPDGAGLGGGSADAAFTLTGLNDMFALGLSRERLAETAATIGADCAFFVYNRPMLATGTGTTLTEIDVDLGGMGIAVVKPPVHISTAEAYAGVTPHTPGRNLVESVLNLPVEQWQEAVTNDFEASVFPRHAEIAEVKRRLIDSGAVYASMSGSGSAVYGLYPTAKLAEKAVGAFKGCDVLAATLR